MDNKSRFPLQVTISALFITLAIVLGGLLSLQNYNKAADMLLSSAQQVFEQLTDELLLEIKGSYQPIGGSLRLLSESPVIEADTLEQRLEHLKSFTISLDSFPAAFATQIAYPNGDYFIVRSLNDDTIRSAFNAPNEAAYMADHVGTNKFGKRLLTRMYFNESLETILSNPDEPTDYDPRIRPWYRTATKEPTTTKPYLFFFTRKVGLTIQYETDKPGVVIASDITLENLTNTINKYDITPGSEAVLINAEGQTFAYSDNKKIIIEIDGDKPELAKLDQLGSDVLSFLSKDIKPVEQEHEFEFDGKQWIGTARVVGKPGGVELFALIVSPVNELLSEANTIRWQSLLVTIIITLAFIPVIWLVAKRISTPLHRLSKSAELISRFEFDKPIETRSHIKEVYELSLTMDMMKSTINRFITLINSLAGEQDLDALLQGINKETMKVSRADGALIYLMNESEDALVAGALSISNEEEITIDHVATVPLDSDNEIATAANRNINSVFVINRDSDPLLQSILDHTGLNTLTVIALPLSNRNNEIIGMLCLLYKEQHAVDADISHNANIAFVQALSGFTAVTLESRQLLHMQEALLNAFIKLIAGAIDAKSPYTAGHCQRVPEITKMLAQAACESCEPPFDDFNLSDKEWTALDIASWLHDCGKVTTPEYVVDKATKLETIYDRIHEIRMRFEVLKRDAEIEYWQQVAEGGDQNSLKLSLDKQLAEIDEDFAFIAECNEGGEFMDDDKIERLRNIAERTWTRTLDDRIGISWEEANRMNKTEKKPIPVEEKLLADKPEHIIEREDYERMPENNPWGFKLDVPEHKYNRGELYNLSVSRGTLSAEERYKINDHMTQTIIMLEKLPYPRHLREVPKIAGGHHETMDGKGYPRRLTHEDMSLTARMMAIADIFEALTASDRPYKKAKSLSEAIRIMSFMRNDNHIDPDLFKLFLTSGVYRKYGEQYLAPEQLDEVDISDYIGQ